MDAAGDGFHEFDLSEGLDWTGDGLVGLVGVGPGFLVAELAFVACAPCVDQALGGDGHCMGVFLASGARS